MKKNGHGFWLASLALGCAAMCLVGCNLTTERTTINTPAVYAVSADAAGALHTNQVSAASVTENVKKERLWLPSGYAVHHDTSGYGVRVSMTDSTTQTPKVEAGVFNDAWWWVPTATNGLFAPPITAAGGVQNKGVPFWLSTKMQFTSGASQASQADTNSVSGAIVPGTPLNQAK